MHERVFYEELTPRQFRERIAQAPIAYLPLGTLEWHGEHLPLGADGLQSRGFFAALAREAGGIVLPMLFVGPDLHFRKGGKDYYGMDVLGFLGDQSKTDQDSASIEIDEQDMQTFVPEFVVRMLKGASDVSPHQLDGSAYRIPSALFKQLLENILFLLKRAGFKIVVAHGHGPSGWFFQRNQEQWEQQFELKLCTCWRSEQEEEDGLGIQTDHAAANETSLMMALYPELVALQNLDPDPAIEPMAVAGKDPRVHASIELGKQIIEKQVARMKDILDKLLEQIKK